MSAPFTIKLGQESYVDDNGHFVSANGIQHLAPYEYLFDGFYKWQCGGCKKIHETRSCGWPVAGQVLVCTKDWGAVSIGGCGATNLLVKTNVRELDECFGMKNTLERETADLRKEQERLQQTIDNQVKQRVAAILEPLKRAWTVEEN